MPVPVVLDTDIGSDVDDALALAVLLGSDEVDLLGVTTVYGDTALRARITRRLVRLSGRDAGLPCVPGLREPLSGKEVWWAGHEGRLYDSLADEPVDDATTAPAWLSEQARRHDGELILIAIGPLTNIAAALRADTGMAERIRRLVVMGGRFADAAGQDPEHNFTSDATAAAEVFASGIPILVTGVEITRQVVLDSDDAARIARAGALGAMLEAETRQWMDYWGEDVDIPHDATTAIALMQPDRLGTEARAVRIDTDGRCHTGTGAPTVTVVTEVQAGPVAQDILARIERADVSSR